MRRATWKCVIFMLFKLNPAVAGLALDNMIRQQGHLSPSSVAIGDTDPLPSLLPPSSPFPFILHISGCLQTTICSKYTLPGFLIVAHLHTA